MKLLKLSLVCFVFMIACQEKDAMLLEGKYEGAFTVTYENESKSGLVILELKDGKYNSSANADRIPAGGSGNYVLAGDKIIFEDMNYWTAEFDWSLILNGEYSYQLKGSKLTRYRIQDGDRNYVYETERKGK